MSMPPNFPRWIVASVTEFIKDTIRTDLSLTFFVEGVDREEKDWFQTDSAVLRVVGPKFYPGGGQDRYKVEVSVIVTDLPDDSENAWVQHDRLGTIAAELCNPIPVLKYGDDESQVGCLDIDPNAAEFVRVVQFGKLDPNTEVVQGAVVAKYEICLDS